MPAGLDPDDFGIGEGAVIGEEGIVFDVIEIRRAELGRAMLVIGAIDVPPLAMPGMQPPFLNAAKICSGGVKLKSFSIITISC